MLASPHTSPAEGSAEAGSSNNGASSSSSSSSSSSLAVGWNCPLPASSPAQLAAVISTDQGYTIAIPTNDTMGLTGSEKAHLDGRPDSPHGLDEDQDMSEGGALLSTNPSPQSNAVLMSPSHAEVLNAEMDILDAEVMGQDNLDQLFLSASPYQPPTIGGPHFYYSDSTHNHPSQVSQSHGDSEDDMMYDGFAHEVTGSTNLPTTTPVLSQQSQYLQDGQGEMDGIQMPDALTQLLDSIPPTFFTMSYAVAGSSSTHSQWDSLTLAPIVSSSSPTDLTLPPLAIHLEGHESGAASPGTDHQNAPPANNSDIGWDDDLLSEADQIEVDDQFNLSLVDFLYTWGRMAAREDGCTRKIPRGPVLPAVLRQRNIRDLAPVERSDLQGDRCDIQRINWMELGVTRHAARQMRRQTYKNYTNLPLPADWHPRLNLDRLSDDENYFKFRRMNFAHNIHLSHFQLRNLVACSSRDHIFYAGVSKVMEYTPTRGSNKYPSTTMDLTDPVVQRYHAYSTGIQISTLTAAHGILVAGGFCGEYGIVNLKANRDTKHTEGLISDHPNSITNHVQVHLSRGSSLPVAAFSSNDNGLRLLDVNTNKFVAEHKYDHAINCSAVSPDQRLRVLVGDACKAMICNAETGEVLQALEAHRDFGFACDWADDGWTVATGNQDMQIKIWDARKWTNSHGVAMPIATIAAEMAGVRKLKFSPCGSGRRVLVAAEPADFVSIINADTFSSKQNLSFFGEIGGVDFTNDGQDLIVANCDSMRGGIMEFERCDFASEALYGLDARYSRMRGGGDWDAEDEGFGHQPKPRRTAMHRARKPAMLGTTMAPF